MSSPTPGFKLTPAPLKKVNRGPGACKLLSCSAFSHRCLGFPVHTVGPSLVSLQATIIIIIIGCCLKNGDLCSALLYLHFYVNFTKKTGEHMHSRPPPHNSVHCGLHIFFCVPTITQRPDGTFGKFHLGLGWMFKCTSSLCGKTSRQQHTNANQFMLHIFAIRGWRLQLAGEGSLKKP